MTNRFSRVSPVDPDDPIVSQALDPPDEDVGEVIALMVEAEARADGWPQRAAAELAHGWSGAGVRVVLADADLSSPTLHQLFDVENGEGISDVVVYGASPSRVALRPGDSGFLFVPSGTVVPDPGGAYRHERWPRILTAIRQSGSVLILFLPAEAEGVDALVVQADRIVRLAPRAPEIEPQPGVIVFHSDRTADVEVSPMVDTSGMGGASPASETDADADEFSEPWSTSDEAVRTDSVPSDERPASDSASKEASVSNATTPAPPRSQEEPTRTAAAVPSNPGTGIRPEVTAAAASETGGPSKVVWVVLVVLGVVAIVVAAAWFGIVTIPGITPAASTMPANPPVLGYANLAG